MLEDRNTIDIVNPKPDGPIDFVIVDAGITTDVDERLELLNHKIMVCLSMLADDEKFEELGRPDVIRVEVRCASEDHAVATVKQVSVATPNGREIKAEIRFTHSPSPYG
ncbi:hypothetical protein LF1_41170 [Rubripirellula obstinata]|uniref:Uncharacterized protein n=1 Tax=Rubripirellula obstinata TaxID=406547 RepID=A0A5B1CK43_9BACT|nr:hypothetical protein [Rubripirellula obstinata]KAA1261567.1 hypothetical protein LF1_41170 [Rubripirellula obstinata]